MDEVSEKINKNVEKIKNGIAIIKNRYKKEELKDCKDYNLLDTLEKNLDDPNKLVEIYRGSEYQTRDENEIKWNSIFDQMVKMNDRPENFWIPFYDLEEILK